MRCGLTSIAGGSGATSGGRAHAHGGPFSGGGGNFERSTELFDALAQVLGDMPPFIVLRAEQTGRKLMQLPVGALDLSKCNAVLRGSEPSGKAGSKASLCSVLITRRNTG
ncbi:MAG: hypothetical protein WB869_02115 [Candidatus Acidiferrales bacterium]